MTRDEAEAEVARRRAERREDAWLTREGAEGWQVVRLAGMGRGPTTETTEAKPKPPTADDPRPSIDRNLGGPWAAGL